MKSTTGLLSSCLKLLLGQHGSLQEQEEEGSSHRIFFPFSSYCVVEHMLLETCQIIKCAWDGMGFLVSASVCFHI